jgi:uncharacterized protein
VREEFEKAKNALRAAEILQAEGLFEDTIPRSYYAVMHVARAALLVHDAIPKSHAAVHRLFGAVLIRPGLIEAEWADVLAREQDRRLLANGSLHVLWEPEASSRLVEVAQASIQRIQEYLVSVGIALE